MSAERNVFPEIEQIEAFFSILCAIHPEIHISDYIPALKDCFIKTKVTENQLTLLLKVLHFGIERDMALQIDFVISDFIDNLHNSEIKHQQPLNCDELTRIITSVIEIETNRKQRTEYNKKIASPEQKQDFDKILERSKFDHNKGNELISNKLDPLLILPDKSINKKSLNQTIQSLQSGWKAQVNQLYNEPETDSLIEANFKKFKKTVDLAYDIFTIRLAYTEMKQTTKKWFSSKQIRPEKSAQLALIEDSFSQALSIPELDFEAEKIFNTLYPVLLYTSASVNTPVFGKSGLSKRIDEIISRYQKTEKTIFHKKLK